jgi:hypothetical protein
MSNRHRTGELLLPPVEERRAFARSERHRVHVALNDVTEQIFGGVEPDDVVEPGVGWKSERRHDPARVKARPGRRRRHWKLKSWKRRSAERQTRAALERAAGT